MSAPSQRDNWLCIMSSPDCIATSTAE